jgi:hypothetical protein
MQINCFTALNLTEKYQNNFHLKEKFTLMSVGNQYLPLFCYSLRECYEHSSCLKRTKLQEGAKKCHSVEVQYLYSSINIQIKEYWLARRAEACGDELNIQTIDGKKCVSSFGRLRRRYCHVY